MSAPSPPPDDLRGKVCVITGASGGIGRETALALGRRGATLALLVRDRQRGQAVLDELRKDRPDAAGQLFVADLSSLAAVRQVAAEVLAAHPRIDILINNAGAIYLQRQTTVDGLERTFATNHLAYFLLTELLLPALKAAAPSRIINVASDAHRRARLDLDDLQSERRYSGFLVYGASKLANILFTRELARRLAGSGVTANSLHPGVVASGFAQNNGPLTKLLTILARPFLINAEQGARTTIFLATDPSVAQTSGQYFARSRQKTPSRLAQDDDLARRLWAASEELVAGR